MKSKKWNLLILALVFLGVFGLVIYQNGAAQLLSLFKSIEPGWMFCAAGMIILYWLLEAGILHQITRSLYAKQQFRNSFSTSMIGQLFNCITPFASGGQPIQAYAMVKSGVPLGLAGSALMVKFIVYQCSLTLYSLVVLLFWWREFSGQVTGFGYLVFLGFSINTLVMLGLFCICFFRRFTRFAAEGLIRLLARLRVVKQQEETLAYAEKELGRFHESFDLIRRHPGSIAASALLSLLQLTVFFLIPYFICLAFGITGTPPGMVVAAESFVTMVSSFVPLPGAAGGAEYSFHVFFAPFFQSEAGVSLAMLLWRMITFYFPILAGSFFFFASGAHRFSAGKQGQTVL